MAQTNVQAFSGDVEISSNLEVGTANLFVDTVNSRVGIGTNEPSYKLNVLTDTNYDGISLRDSTRELLKIAKGNNGSYINMFDSDVSKVNISTSGDSWFNGGNVGIGVANPHRLLDVSDTTGETALHISGLAEQSNAFIYMTETSGRNYGAVLHYSGTG